MSRIPLNYSSRRSQICDRDKDSAEEKQAPKYGAQPAPFQKFLKIIFVQKTPGALDPSSETAGVVGKDHAKRARAESEPACIPQSPQGRTRCQPAGVYRQLRAQFVPTPERLIEMTHPRDRKKCENDDRRTEKQGLVIDPPVPSKAGSNETDQQQQDQGYADQLCHP